jgi:hypothetical protein
MPIPALQWAHPIGPTTCQFCIDTISAYDGIIVLPGSPEYLEISGPYHPNCAQEWHFIMVDPSELGTPVKGIIDSIPVESDTWNIGFKHLWPLAVFAAMIEKAKDKPVPEPDLSYQDIGYDPELVMTAVSEIRKLVKKGDLTIDAIRDRIYRKYGINGYIAIQETEI